MPARLAKHTRTAFVALLAVAALCLATPRPAAAASTSDVVNAAYGSAGLTSQVKINGLLGGTVTAGRMTVVVPPFAIAGTAVVTVTQPDTSALVVELNISPASLNHFALPVLLTMRAGGLISLDLLKGSRIERYDPVLGQWVPVAGSVVSVAGLTLQAPLWHFSTYRATGGKAGW